MEADLDFSEPKALHLQLPLKDASSVDKNAIFHLSSLNENSTDVSAL